MIYILDTNVISDYINAFEPTTARIKQVIREGDALYLCEPVLYEIRRGLIYTNASRKQHVFETQFMPLLATVPLMDADWQQAAHFWADARHAGKQLSDVDLLIAALAHRLDGVIVSSDEDFDALSVHRVDWREL